jgi:uncharacterized repeat protein (TIGR01451 family)
MSHPSRRWLPPLSRPSPRAGRPVRAPRSRRPQLEGLEQRTVLSVSIAPTNLNGSGYAALSFAQSGGYTPPDTCGAAGPSAYVETVNQTVALTTSKSNGGGYTYTPLSTFWFTTGGLARADGSSGLSDPIVAYNDQIGRFIVGDQDVDGSRASTFDIAVSKTNSPASLGSSDWNFYQINTTESGYTADYPGNFGYNHDAFVFTLNMFGTTTSHAMVVSVNNADLAGNVSQSSLRVYKNDINDGSLRPTTMHDSVAGDPMWLVTEHGDGKSIDVIKETNVLTTSPTFAYTNLAVTPYSGTVYPRNPNGTVITNNIDARIMKAAEWKNTIVASHSVSVSSTEDDAQWYAVDVSSGTPTLKDQGRVSGGNNTYLTYPSIDINSSGQIGMTYMRSGTDTSTDYLSMYVTGRAPSDTAGTMETPVLVPAGKGQANYKDFSTGGRAGDLSGINVDPVDGSFWAANEYANTETTANWGTAIANFLISSPLPSTDMAVTISGPSSVTAGDPNGATYTITITNNGPASAQGVVLTDALPSGSTVMSMSRTSGTDSFTFAQSGGKETATASGNLLSGASDTFSLQITVPSNLAAGSGFTDTASVQASNTDPSTGNNSASTTASVVNTTPNADVSVSVSGPATANEGGTITYSVTVTNNSSTTIATGVTLTDTLPGITKYVSATGPGTPSVSGGTVTFSIGDMAAGATVTATVTAQATEDGSSSDSASVSATTQDPNPANNSASASTSFAEPAIVVSGAISTKNTSFSGQVATFTHASGVEPASAFVATINWGDGNTSTGTITQSGTSYVVTGSHSYRKHGNHTITTTVTETSNAVDKLGDDSGGKSWKRQDVVQLPSAAHSSASSSASPAGGSSTTGVGATAVTQPIAPLTPAVVSIPVSPAANNGSVRTISPVATTSADGTATGIAVLDLSAIPQGASDGAASAAGLEPLSWMTPGIAGRRRLGSRPN